MKKEVTELGARILGALKQKEQTQLWLAEQAGVTPQAVTKWLRTGKIGRDRAVRVAAVLGLSVDSLLSGDDSVMTQWMLPVFRDLPAELAAETLDFLEFRVARFPGLSEERRREIHAAIEAARSRPEVTVQVERRRFREFSEWPGPERRQANQPPMGRRRRS